MIAALLRFEWRYHARHAAFRASCALFLLTGFALAATGFGPEYLQVTSPYLVTQSTAFVSLLSLFAVAVFVASAVLRDGDYRMADIIHSTPVRKRHYVVSRFGGAMLAGLSATALASAGLAVAAGSPWLDAERVGSLDASPYVMAFVFMTLPNVLFVTAVLFSIAVWTRNAVATMVAAVALYGLYFVGAALTNSPLMAASTPGAGSGLTAAVLDPFGLTAFFHDTRFWTAAEKNTRAIPLAGALLANRIAVVGASLVLWGTALATLSFRSSAKRTTRRGDDATDGRPGSVTRVLATPTTSRRAATIAAFGAGLRMELRLLFRSVPFLLAQLAWAIVAITEIHSAVFDFEYGAAAYPSTVLIASTLATPTTLFSLVLLLYIGAEVFWREQSSRFASILNATPRSSVAALASKCTALVIMVLLTSVVGIVVGIATQFVTGYTRIDPPAYLEHLWFTSAPLLAFVALFALIHALSPGKYAGLVACLIAVIAARQAGRLGLDHPLWSYGSVPSIPWSEMTGPGYAGVAFNWFMLHWSITAVLLLVVSAARWRSTGEPVRSRLRALRAAGPRFRRAAALLGLLVVCSGCWIFYNTSVVTEERSAEEVNAWKAAYETRYAFAAAEPRPRIIDVQASFELDPERRAMRVRGTYVLANEGSVPISSMLVSVRRDAGDVRLALRNAEADGRDERFGVQRFRLSRPLAPGAATELDFDLTITRNGFAAEERGITIARNGSFFFGYLVLPGLGYRASYEIQDPDERRRQGLPARPARQHADLWMDEVSPDNDRTRFLIDVVVPDDQVVVAPGELVTTMSDGARKTWRFQSTEPILNRFAVSAARYDVATRQAGDTRIELYHHPSHAANAKRILDATAAMLAELEPRLDRYRAPALKLAEVPATVPFGAFATPETVFLSESRVMLVNGDAPGRVDLVTRRVAHEVAHQWWGHGVTPADGPGASTIVESLTKYSELLAMRRVGGDEQARMQRELEQNNYLSGRSRVAREESLAEAREQAHVYYAKGSIVFSGAAELVGRDRFDAGLASFFRDFEPRPGRATTADLLRHISAATTPENAALIDEWFRSIVLYDLSVKSATARRRSDGRYDVEVEVSARKLAVDRDTWKESDRPLDEEIPIALSSFDTNRRERVISQQPVRLRSGINRMTLIAGEAPEFATIDRDVLRIDTNRADNVARLTR